jgi:hypothetical protein
MGRVETARCCGRVLVGFCLMGLDYRMQGQGRRVMKLVDEHFILNILEDVEETKGLLLPAKSVHLGSQGLLPSS